MKRNAQNIIEVISLVAVVGVVAIVAFMFINGNTDKMSELTKINENTTTAGVLSHINKNVTSFEVDPDAYVINTDTAGSLSATFWALTPEQIVMLYDAVTLDDVLMYRTTTNKDAIDLATDVRFGLDLSPALIIDRLKDKERTIKKKMAQTINDGRGVLATKSPEQIAAELAVYDRELLALMEITDNVLEYMQLMGETSHKGYSNQSWLLEPVDEEKMQVEWFKE